MTCLSSTPETGMNRSDGFFPAPCLGGHHYSRHAMTRDEIRLVVFVLLALAVGTTVQWWKRSPELPVAPRQVETKRKGWADPPYLFKSRGQMDQVKKNVELSGGQP